MGLDHTYKIMSPKECFSEVKAVDFAKKKKIGTSQPQPEANVTLASVRNIDAVVQKNVQAVYKFYAVVT